MDRSLLQIFSSIFKRMGGIGCFCPISLRYFTFAKHLHVSGRVISLIPTALNPTFKSQTGNLTEDRQKVDSWQLGRLGLRLFDNDVDDEGSAYLSAEDFSVDDLPALSADAPLEMDILVHFLMR